MKLLSIFGLVTLGMAQKNKKPDKQAKSKKKSLLNSVRVPVTKFFGLSVVTTNICFENSKTGSTLVKPEVPLKVTTFRFRTSLNTNSNLK